MKRFYLPIVLVITLFSSITTKTCYAEANKLKCLSSDREALLEFKDNLNDPENILSSWTGNNCCELRGIGCDNVTGAIMVIDRHNPYPLKYDSIISANRKYKSLNLSGEISPSLLQLKSLQYLDLSSNTFKGIPIPKFFGSLKNLRYLNLLSAGFSGIPPSLGNLSQLEYLDVSSPTFSMSVNSFEWMSSLVSLRYLGMDQVDLSLVNPNWLEKLNKLPHLTELHLSTCHLSGSISNLSPVNFTSLAVIDLRFNGFSSMFPDWIANISSLEYDDLSYCMLRGRIPLVLGDLPNLRYLDLVFNGNLSAGSFALFSRSWKGIEALRLGVNKVHGQIPANIGNLTSLTDFDLSGNNIFGGIPSTIGSLCNLVNFVSLDNNMTGNLPEQLDGTEHCASSSSLPRLVSLRQSNNQMIGTLPD